MEAVAPDIEDIVDKLRKKHNIQKSKIYTKQ